MYRLGQQGAALVVYAPLGLALALLGRPTAVGFVVGTTAIVSHLLADVITPMGITPFWPVSDRHYTFDICRADNTLANYALLALGLVLTVAAVAVAPI